MTHNVILVLEVLGLLGSKFETSSYKNNVRIDAVEFFYKPNFVLVELDPFLIVR